MTESKSLSLEFHYASMGMVPFVDVEGDDSRLLKNIIQKLNSGDFPDEKKVIDRFKERKGNTKRRLVHISSPFDSKSKGKRCFGRIALIKNKAPKLWSGNDVVHEIEKGLNKEFIEVTNYAINFNNSSKPVIMIEFNSSGPRLSDLEYYIRQVGAYFRIAKGVSTTYHLSTNYADLSKSLVNVFSVNIKMNSAKLLHANDSDWVKNFATLKDESGYQDVRVEMFYQRAKEENGWYKKNIGGLKYARKLIDWLKKDENNIDKMEDLKMVYQTNPDEEPIELDFIKNKTTSMLEIPLITSTQYRRTDLKFLMGQELNTYLNTGETTSEN